MAIHSTPFSGVHLTGEDARAFEEQIALTPTNPAVQLAIMRGAKLVQEMRASGAALIRARKAV